MLVLGLIEEYILRLAIDLTTKNTLSTEQHGLASDLTIKWAKCI